MVIFQVLITLLTMAI